MGLLNQSGLYGTFSGLLPPTSSELEVMYYVKVVDELSWTNQTGLYTAQIDYLPTITNVSHIGEYIILLLLQLLLMTIEELLV